MEITNKSCLHNLIKEVSDGDAQDFRKKVGVVYDHLIYQMSSKNTLNFALKYAIKLGVNKIEGIERGKYVKIQIKKNV